MKTRVFGIGALLVGTLLVGTWSVVTSVPPTARAQPASQPDGRPGTGGDPLSATRVSRLLGQAGLSDRRLLAAGLDATQIAALRASFAGSETLNLRALSISNAEAALRQALTVDRTARANQLQTADDEQAGPSAAVREAEAAYRQAKLQLREAVLATLPPGVPAGLAAVEVAERFALPLEFAPAITSPHQARQLQRALSRERVPGLIPANFGAADDSAAVLAAARANPAVVAARSRLATLPSAPSTPVVQPPTVDDR